MKFARILGTILVTFTVPGVYVGYRIYKAYGERNARLVKFSTVAGRRGALYALGYRDVEIVPEKLNVPVPQSSIKRFQQDWSEMYKAAKASEVTTGMKETSAVRKMADAKVILMDVGDIDVTGIWSDDTFEALESAMVLENGVGVLFTEIEF